MWLYKDKGDDGVRLNNGDDGGGDWVFNKNGHFYFPQAIHAAGATYQEDGNIHGSVWGGHLSSWVDNKVDGRATWDYVNTTFVRDIRLGNPQHAVWGSHGGQAPNGHVLIGGNFDNNTEWPIYAPIQKNINGNWINIQYVGVKDHDSNTQFQSLPSGV